MQGNPALIAYDSLPSRFKAAIEAKVGCHPRSLVKRGNLFEKEITYDEAASDFFASYLMRGEQDSRSTLPPDTQCQYVSTASLLNFVGKQAMAVAGTGRFRSKVKMWEWLSEVVAGIDTDAWPHALPANGRRLRDRYLRYKEEGYGSLVHRNFQNNNSQVITEEVGTWLLARWADQVRVIPSLAHLLVAYNAEAAVRSGWKKIKHEQTLHNWLYAPERKHLWYGHRHGDGASKSKFMYTHRTKLPTLRDSLWYGDGTKLNYYYRYRDGNNKWQRGTLTVYEVMDAYSEVFLGFCINKSEDYRTIYEAFKMAVQTARHRPYEIRIDNQGGGKKLTQGHFLTAVAKMAIHTKPYNGPSKTIESAFGRFQQQYLKKDWFFTGQNVKAKRAESQQRKEFINAQPLEAFPTLEEVLKIYKERRQEWNEAAHHATGVSRVAMYEGSNNPQTPSVDEEDMVRLFWVLRPKPITMRAEGLRVRRGADEDYYVVMASPGMPDIAWSRRNIDRKFWVYEDPSNGEVVQLCTGAPENLRLSAQAELKTLTNRGKQEQAAWEAEYYRKVDAANEAERVSDFNEMEDILKSEGRSAADYGMANPGLLGVKKTKTKVKGVKEIGEVLKAESCAEEAEDMDLLHQI
ncbi:MAG: hypothetical protein GDA51_01840 [Ekhidna sp.]|nr:hypothetical protein [Ekhidna sp.]